MLCLAVPKIPEGPEWEYELKLDGYRAIGGISKHGAALWSRNRKDFSRRFSGITKALEELPANTVVDGEIVAVDDEGRPHSICCRTSMGRGRQSSFMRSTCCLI